MPLPHRFHDRDQIQGLVPSAFVEVLALYLESQGIPRQHVVPADLLNDCAQPLNPVSAERYCAMLMKAAERLDDPLLGLHLGQSIRAAHIGALGYVLRACNTLGDALIRLRRYHRLLQDINPMSYEVANGCIELRWGIAHGRPGALFDEAAMTSLVQFSRDLCRQPLQMELLDFVNPPPADTRPYTAFFGCPVRFGQRVTRMLIPLSVLATPLPDADPNLLRLLEQQMDAVMMTLPQEEDLLTSVRRAVVYLAPQGVPDLEHVAQLLHMSPRVLYRRLVRLGTNYRDQRELALSEAAQRHLQHGNLSFTQVGALLGYAEQSAFTRSFRRWTGMSPTQWCESHKKAGTAG